MPARGGRGDPGFYPERDAAREAPLDRLVSGIGALVRRLGARSLKPAGLAAEVATHAARFRAGAPASHVPALRYRLRRDGLAGAQLAECFGLYVAALPAGTEPPHPAAFDAAAALTRGAQVDVTDAHTRGQALALAAAAFALCGVPVHLHAVSDRRAAEAAALLRGPLGALGLGVAEVHSGMRPPERRVAYGAAIACGTPRVMALDYLRDRLQLGRRLRPLQSRLERLSGDTTSSGQLPLLSGLHCALVDDADLVLVDEARAPLSINADADSSPDRLPFEQAHELTGALEPGADFELGEGGASFTPQGAERLAQLSILLGGLWAVRQTREDLVGVALVARHAMQRGRDYEVAQGALKLPAAGEGGPTPAQEMLQRLLEVKEGLPFAGRREVLARITIPQFFRRYLRLAGVCADARGLEGELWSVYGLDSVRAGEPAHAPAYAARAFAASAQRRAALVRSVSERAARGDSVVVALRAAPEAGALAAALQEAGVRFVVLRGQADADEQAALAALARPGTVALSLFPAQRGVARAASAEAPLHLAVAELHDARRHIAQIERAYAAASCTQFLALEDEGIGERLGALAAARWRRAAGGGELESAAAARLARAAQRAAERASARGRREAQARAQAIEDLLAFSGRPE